MDINAVLMFLSSLFAFDTATSVPWYDLPITFETNILSVKEDKLD